MGNFETAIPKHIKFLEKEMAGKRWKILDIEREYNHDCDCEYCTVAPEPVPEDEQKIIDDLEVEISDIKALINRLKVHAKIHKVKVPA